MAFKPIEILINAKDNASAVFGSLRDKMNGIGDAAQRLVAQLAAAFTIKGMADASAEMETLKVGLQAVSGSAEKAAQDMEFVRRMASQAGVEVASAGGAFLGLSAATRGTAVEGEATRAVFEAVIVSMSKAGKSSAETSNALRALGQMASKGVVQSEELRGQLGEALPGALNAAAKGLGITTAELMKLVEQGQITAQDLFPALTRGLNELYGTAASGGQTLSQEFVNIKNAFVEMSASIGESGGLAALKTGAEVAQAAIVILGDTIVRTGKSIGVMVAALATMDFSGLKQSFADIEAEGRDKLLKAAAHNEVLRNALSGTGDAAFQAALAQQQAATAATQAGAQASVAKDQWIQLNNGYGQVVTSLRDQIAEQEKSVIARDAEGKASVALAAAFGTELEQRNAQAKAAAENAAQQQELAKLRQTELETMRAQLAALREEADAQGGLSQERQKQVAELEKQIGLRSRDAEKAIAQAAASELVAEKARAEAEAYKDNSGRINELRENYELLTSKLEKLRAAQAAGKATLEEVAKAEIEAGKAAVIYRDAIQDQLRAIEAKRNAHQAELDLQTATIRLAIEQQRAAFEVARARGDEAGAMRAQNEIRKLEIQLLGLVAQSKRAEAQAALASIAARREELVASGQLTEAKRLELVAAEKAAKVKIKEAEIAEVTAKKVKDLADAHNSLSKAADGSSKSIDSVTDSMDRHGRAADGSRGRTRSTTGGFGGAGGGASEEADRLREKAADMKAAGQELAAAYLLRQAEREEESVRSAQQIEDARNTHTGNVEVPQEIIDAEVRRRLGEEWVGNEIAQRIIALRTKLEQYYKYGGPTSREGQAEANAVRKALERAEAELEAARSRQDAANRQTTPPAREGSVGGISAPVGGSPGGGRGGGQPVGGPALGPQGGISIVINANGVNDPVKLARLLEPELKKINALRR